MPLLWTTLAHAATLSVGPSGAYATPCTAIAAASPGDRIEVDAAGDYAGDSCAWSTDNLTIAGVNGRPVLDGTGAPMAEQKGIFVVHAPTATIENLEFRGASVPDANGAGIRHQGTDLVVNGCRFVDNQNGILGSPITDGTGSVTITGSEFDHNGAGDGYSHNLYLGHYASVELRASYSHRGNVGHLFKSRALNNRIIASRLTDESGGAASYEIDVPNGGSTWIIGSIVEQVGTTQNSAMIAYAEETSGLNPALDLHVVNSTLVNHHDRGTFLSIGASATTPIEVVNTVLTGPGTLSTQAAAVFTACWTDADGDPGLDDAAALDVGPVAGSPLIDAGAPPPVAVDAEYVHPAAERARGVAGAAIDIGAYEYGNPGIPTDTGDTGDTAGPGDTADADDTADAGDTANSGDTAATTPPDGACGCASGPRDAAWGLALLGGLISRRRRGGSESGA